MVCVLNVLHVTVLTFCTDSVAEGAAESLSKREGKMTRQGDKWNGKGVKKIWKERKKGRKKKIEMKLVIKTYWRLLMLSEPCRHKISAVRTRGNVCLTAGNIGRTTWRL